MATFRELIAGLSPTHTWRLDETTGTNADDAVGTLDGTYLNTPTLGVSPLIAEGKAVTFDRATNEYVTIPDHADLKGQTSMSVVMAINFSTVPNGNNMGLFGHSGFSATSPGAWRWFAAELFGARLTFQCAIGTTETAVSVTWTPVAATRYLLGFVYTGSVARFYVNGAQVGTDQAIAGGTLGTTSTDGGTIGANSTANQDVFAGTIDEVSYWKNVTLTGTNMSNLYAAIDSLPANIASAPGPTGFFDPEVIPGGMF